MLKDELSQSQYHPVCQPIVLGAMSQATNVIVYIDKDAQLQLTSSFLLPLYLAENRLQVNVDSLEHISNQHNQYDQNYRDQFSIDHDSLLSC